VGTVGASSAQKTKVLRKKHGEPWDKKVYEGITERTLANYAIKDLFLSLMNLMMIGYDYGFSSFVWSAVPKF